MTDNNITLTAEEYKTLKSFRAHSRRWEDRCKEAQAQLREALAGGVPQQVGFELQEVLEDRDRWKSRAKFNAAQVQLLREQQADLLNRLGEK